MLSCNPRNCNQPWGSSQAVLVATTTLSSCTWLSPAFPAQSAAPNEFSAQIMDLWVPVTSMQEAMQEHGWVMRLFYGFTGPGCTCKHLVTNSSRTILGRIKTTGKPALRGNPSSVRWSQTTARGSSPGLPIGPVPLQQCLEQQKVCGISTAQGKPQVTLGEPQAAPGTPHSPGTPIPQPSAC